MRGARLLYVAEPDEERRARAAELAPKAVMLPAVDEALADPKLDALVIASPTPTHVPLAKAALRAGKHVLVEKPLAPDAASGRTLVRLADRRDRVLMVGHLLLHHPAVQSLRRLVRDGRLGEVRYLTGQRTNHGRIRTDEGALLSLAPHDVSVMSYVLGAWPVGVSARGARFAQPEFDDLVFLGLRFPGGVLGHVHLSWLDPLKVRRVSVVGDRQMAVFDDMKRESPLTVHPLAEEPGRKAQPARVVRHRVAMALTEELKAFVRAIRTGEPPVTPGSDGVRVAQVLDAATRSLAEDGREVRLRIR